MPEPDSVEITELLHRWRGGSHAAFERLVPLVYDELRRIARAHLRRERAAHTLEPTALVHQAYERLFGVELEWRDRAHFLNMASRTLRRVLVDHARARGRQRRGGDLERITLDVSRVDDAAESGLPPLLDLDRALDELERFDGRKSQLVQGHYFAGLSYRELAEVHAVSEATVHRELRLAKAWLGRHLA